MSKKLVLLMFLVLGTTSSSACYAADYEGGMAELLSSMGAGTNTFTANQDIATNQAMGATSATFLTIQGGNGQYNLDAGFEGAPAYSGFSTTSTQYIYVNDYGKYDADTGVVSSAVKNFSSANGAFLVNAGSAYIKNSVFDNNKVTGAGGVISNSSNLIVRNSAFLNNSAATYGGAIYSSMNAGKIFYIDNSTFENNSITSSAVAYGGGAIYMTGTANKTIMDSTFRYNYANEFSGGNALRVLGTNNFIFNSIFENNGKRLNSDSSYTAFGKFGGAINNAGNLYVWNSVFDSNISKTQGGAIRNGENASAIITLDYVTIKNNTATGEVDPANAAGGGLFNYGGVVTVNNSIFENNSALANGGAIYSNLGSVTVNGSKFIGNYTLPRGTATSSAAAISTSGVLTVNGSIFDGNVSLNPAGSAFGGAIYLYNNINGNSVIKNSIFKNNVSTWGGAIFQGAATTRTFSIINSSFYNNYVTNLNLNNFRQGGAICVNTDRLLNLVADGGISLFSGNFSQKGEDVYSSSIANFGKLYLNAGNGGYIKFDDVISGDDEATAPSANTYVNSVNGAYPTDGNIIFNNLIRAQNVNLYSGMLTIGEYRNYLKTGIENYFGFSTLTLNGGILNTANEHIDTNTLYNFTSSASASWIFDADLQSSIADNFTVSNTASGSVTLGGINIFGDSLTDSGSLTLFDKPISTSQVTAYTAYYKYNFNASATGVVDYTRTSTSGPEAGFKDALANADGGLTRSVSLSSGLYLLDDLGPMATDSSSLYVFGSPYNSIAGNSHQGTSVSVGQNLYFFNMGNYDKNTLSALESVRGFLSSSSGGFINNAGKTYISNSVFSQNSSSIDSVTEGGGVLFNSGTLSVYDSFFGGQDVSYKNNAYRGGAIYNSGTAHIYNSTFANNNADISGGAIYSTGNTNIVNSSFSYNTATSSGGAIAQMGGSLTITNGVFQYNSSNDYGGGIYVAPSLTLNIFSDVGGTTLFRNNFGGISGYTDLYLEDGAIVYLNSGLEGKISLLSGIKSATNNVSINIANPTGSSVFTSGDYYFKGQILNPKFFIYNGTTDFTSATMKNSVITAYGGFQHFTNSFVQNNSRVILAPNTTSKALIATFNNTQFKNNTVNTVVNGVGLNISALTTTAVSMYTDVDIIGGTFLSNVGTSSASGGAIYNSASASNYGNAKTVLDIDGTTFISNSITSTPTYSGGGAIHNYALSSNMNMAVAELNIKNAKFENNIAYTSSYSGGGAIYNYGKSMSYGYSEAVVNIKNTDFINNDIVTTSTYAGGGALMNLSSVTRATRVKAIMNVEDSHFVSNSTSTGVSYAGGGAIFNYGLDAYLNIKNSTFGGVDSAEKNSSNYNGGAIYNLAGKVDISGANTWFKSNVAQAGGAIVNGAASYMTISDGLFAYNNAYSEGGAIYNGGKLSITNGTSFVKNYATSTSGVVNGGAIRNSTTDILSIVGTADNKIEFLGNYTTTSNASSFGGAIHNSSVNASTLVSHADFRYNGYSDYDEVNKTATAISTVRGGAIYNSGKLTVENSIFKNNGATYIGSAIYNSGTLNINSGTSFVENIAKTSATNNASGAIYSDGVIAVLNVVGSDISFVKNAAISTSASLQALGGAIGIGGNTSVTISGTTDSKILFLGNYTSSDNAVSVGGAISKYTGVSPLISYSEFRYNGYSDYDLINDTASIVSTKQGGAIYNYGWSLNVENSVFKNNAAKDAGGAIYANNYGNTGYVYVLNSIFENNSTDTLNGGGAIYCLGRLHIRADAGETRFTGNTAGGQSNAIYVATGWLYINSGNGGVVQFDDEIVAPSARDLEINNSVNSPLVDGTVIFNNKATNFNFKLYDGLLKFGSGSYINSRPVTLLGGTLSLQNSSATDVANIGAFTSSEGAKISFDVDMALGLNDKFTCTSATGPLGIDNVNILADGDTSSITLFTGGVAPTLSDFSASSSIYKYIFKVSSTAGVYDISKFTLNSINLAFADVETPRSFIMNSDADAEFALGDMAVAGSTLTIDGNGFSVNGLGYVGGGVLLGQTLNVNGVGSLNPDGTVAKSWNGFVNALSGGALANAGTTNISDSVFYNNRTSVNGGAIVNDGIVTLNSSDFYSNNATENGGAIYNTGTLNINAGTSFVNNNATSSSGNVKGGSISIAETGILTITGTEAEKVKFMGNYTSSSNAVNYGGAIYNASTSALNSLTHSIFEYNGYSDYNQNDIASVDEVSTNRGGAIFNTANTNLSVSNSSFKNNVASTYGGAIYNNGTLRINSGTEFINNAVEATSSAVYGGAIANSSKILIVNGTAGNYVDFIGNYTQSTSTTSFGGSIYNSSSNASNSINYANFEYNGYSDYVEGLGASAGSTKLGGAIFNTGELQVSNSIFNNNISTIGGGAIYNKGVSKVNAGSDFINNMAKGTSDDVSGGAIYNEIGILNVAGALGNEVNFSGNYTATSNATSFGGAIFNKSTNALNSVNYAKFEYNGYNDYVEGAGASTISTKRGGALYNDTSALITISNSVFKNNAADSQGGAIYNNGDLRITSNTSFFKNNVSALSSDVSGGGIYNNTSGIISIIGDSIDKVDFLGNYTSSTSAESYGGAIRNLGTSTSNIIQYADFEYNGYSDYIEGAGAAIASTKQGGAIYNDANANLTIYDSVFKNNASTNMGGSIYNAGAMAINSGSNFINNSVIAGVLAAQGGAIVNANSGILTVTGLPLSTISFLGNYTSTTAPTSFGGAIYNSGISLLNKIEYAKFEYNGYSDYVEGTSASTISTKKGGAIYNSTSAAITISNSVFKNNASTYQGGAIYNRGNSTINLGTSFINNSSLSVTEGVSGGAIANESGTLSIIGTNTDNISFSGNYTSSPTSFSHGGAIYNISTNSSNMIDYTNFEYNGYRDYDEVLKTASTVTTKQGGAIWNGAGGIFTISNSSFRNNASKVKGGAIYNGGILTLNNTTFENNKVEAANSGGAIYNTGTLTVNSDNFETVFSSNTSNGVSNAIYSNGGAINLNAGNGGSIRFEDSLVSSVNSHININQDATLNSGTIFFNSSLSNYTLNLYNGTLKPSSANVISNVSNNLNLYGGVLDLQNNSADDVVVLNSFYSDASSKIRIDADFAAGKNDKFSVSSASGTLNVDDVNVMSDAHITSMALFTGGIAPTLTSFELFTSDYRYQFSQSSTAGVYDVIAISYAGLNYAIERADNPRTFSATRDTDAEYHLGNMGGADSSLTIYGNNHSINGLGYAGVNVLAGQTLNILDAGVLNPDGSVAKSWNGFVSSNSGGAVNNSGILNVSSSVFSNNISTIATANNGGGAIYNDLSATTVINGSTFYNNSAIKGGAIFNRGDLTINAGSQFIKNSAKNNADLAYGGAIYNDTDAVVKILGTESNKIKFMGNYISTTNVLNAGGALYNYSTNSLNEIKYADFAYNGYSDYDLATNTASIASTRSGGAILNQTNANLTISNSVFRNNATYYMGGAISSNGNLLINNGTKFVGNRVLGTTDTVYGGAILNAPAGALTVLGTESEMIKFLGNYTVSTNATNTGGAIYNQSTTSLNSIKYALFEYNGYSNYNENTNTATTISTRFGGVLFNSTNSKMTISDSIFRHNGVSDGGAVFYSRGNLDLGENILIVNNKVESLSTTARGGAMFNQTAGVFTITGTSDKLVKFLGNYTNTTNATSYGGAIYNLGTSALNSVSYTNFEFNGYSDYDEDTNSATTVTTKYGGAIYNDTGASISISNSTFNNNAAKIQGGAIYNNGTIKLTDTVFTSNKAENSGGAIFNSSTGILTMNADTKNITFSNNTDATGANDIYNAGILNLNTNESKTITFNGSIRGNGTVNLNSDLILNKGDFVFNDNVSANTMNLYAGKASFAAGKTLNLSTLNLEGGIFDVANGSATDSIILDNFAVSNGASLSFDVDFSTGENDKFTAVSAVGSLNIESLNILADGEADALTLFSGGVAPTLSAFDTFTSNYQYFLTPSTTTDGIFDVRRISISGLNYVVSDVVTPRSFSATQDTSAEYNLGTMGGADSTLTINGNNYSINGNNYEGMNVLSGQTLNINSVGSLNEDSTVNKSWNGFVTASNGGAINNAGTLNISNSIFNNNTSAQSGGVVYSSGSTNVSSSAFIANKANVSGGAIYADTSTLNLTNTSFKNNMAQTGLGGAIYAKNSIVNLVASSSNVSFLENTASESSSAIHLDTSTLNLNASEGNYITFSDKITSSAITNAININKTGSENEGDPTVGAPTLGNVYFNNSVSNSTLNLYNGVAHIGKDNYLDGNNVNIYGGTLNLANGTIGVANFNNLAVYANANLGIDADLAYGVADKITSANLATGSGKLNIAYVNILSDANVKNSNIVIADDNVREHIGLITGEAQSQLYKYKLSYNSSTGAMGFLSSREFNSSVISPAVATTVGNFLNQSATYQEAIGRMDALMFMPKADRLLMQYRNKVASAEDNFVFSPTFFPEEDEGAWVKQYTTFENVPLTNGPNVSNIGYGILVGKDSKLKYLGNGYSGYMTAYMGYNGSTQRYSDVSSEQNGGLIGVTGTVYKGNFFAALTASVGASNGTNNTNRGADNFTTIMAGAAIKTGYNFEFLSGKLIVQPSFMMSYTFMDTFDYTSASGARITSDPLNPIQLSPGIKVIGNLKDGWQPYIGANMVWNLMDTSKFYANGVQLPQMSVEPYLEYGVGLQRQWGRFTGFGQAMARSGGRNGVALQFGFRWSLGR